VRHSAFHSYVRAVFAARSARSKILRKRRAVWLHLLSRRYVERITGMNMYSR
jgi:hypothetical protein